MKSTLTQYVTLGVMLLLLVFIVSMFPEQNSSKVTGHKETPTTVSKMAIETRHKAPVRAD
jgi:hypothetical protein